MEVPYGTDQILEYLRKEALKTTRDVSPHLIFFSLISDSNKCIRT